MNIPHSLSHFAEHFIDVLGEGVFIDLSDSSKIHELFDISNQELLQEFFENYMKEQNTNWALSSFGEYREKLFTQLEVPQMVDQKRFYHLGVDLWAPIGTKLFTPIDGEIIETGFEEGFGNYGGYVIIKHDGYYSFYGHLNPNTLKQKGEIVAGESFAEFGNMDENGGYFSHTHIQVLTEKGYEEGFASKGYATEDTFNKIQQWVLDPLVLAMKK